MFSACAVQVVMSNIAVAVAVAVAVVRSAQVLAARLSTAVNKALGHWHETVAGCNVKRCQAPKQAGD